MPPVSREWTPQVLGSISRHLRKLLPVACYLLLMKLIRHSMISTQIWSPFHDTPPRPAIPDFRLPDCYKVNNVQPLRNKISNFNEETLMWIFYSCPGDYQQQLAAEQL